MTGAEDRVSLHHPQLLDIERQLDATARRAELLAARAGPDRWQARPLPTQWSPSECVQHLGTTIDAFLPLIDAALESADRPEAPVTRTFRPNLFGRVLLWVIEPPYRIRTKTGDAFVPPATRTSEVDLAELAERHRALRQRLVRADGHPLDRLTIVSPFDARVRYSLFTTFCIVPAHERRHLWQGERAIDQMGRAAQ